MGDTITRTDGLIIAAIHVSKSTDQAGVAERAEERQPPHSSPNLEDRSESEPVARSRPVCPFQTPTRWHCGGTTKNSRCISTA
jgi:hypothetical protein